MKNCNKCLFRLFNCSKQLSNNNKQCNEYLTFKDGVKEIQRLKNYSKGRKNNEQRNYY